MSVYQFASGSCTGRGFASVDSSGFLAYFKNWVVKDATDGGPNWNILIDKSPVPTSVSFTVNTQGSSHILDATGHGYLTGEIVQLSNTGGALPTGLNINQDYYIYKINDNQFRVCSFITSAWAGTGTSITSNGTGTHYALMEGPYIVVSDQSSLSRNQPAMISKVGYKILESGKIRVNYPLACDTTNKILFGFWAGHAITTVDSGPFSYDFRGGAECLIMQSRIGSAWSTSMIDSWLGDSNFVEGTDKIGALAGDATAGSNVVLQLGVGQAANFTPNNYYYIYDMSGHAWVNYCKVTADDTLAHTITVDSISNNFPTGSVIAAYAHRYYASGSDSVSGMRFNTVNSPLTIPYCSNTTANKAFPDQNATFYQATSASVDSVTLDQAAPTDKGFYACQKPFLVERYNCVQNQTDGMSEGLGIAKNAYVTDKGAMVGGLDGRTIGGKNWLYFQSHNNFSYGGNSGMGVMFCDSTTLV